MKKNLLINFLKKITIMKILLFFSFYFGIGSYSDFAISDFFEERADTWKQKAYAREVKRIQKKMEAKGINRFIKPNINNRHPDYRIAWQYEESGTRKLGFSAMLLFFATILGTIRWIRKKVRSR